MYVLLVTNPKGKQDLGRGERGRRVEVGGGLGGGKLKETLELFAPSPRPRVASN